MSKYPYLKYLYFCTNTNIHTVATIYYAAEYKYEMIIFGTSLQNDDAVVRFSFKL